MGWLTQRWRPLAAKESTCPIVVSSNKIWALLESYWDLSFLSLLSSLFLLLSMAVEEGVDLERGLSPRPNFSRAASFFFFFFFFFIHMKIGKGTEGENENRKGGWKAPLFCTSIFVRVFKKGENDSSKWEKSCTALFIHSVARFLIWVFGEFPRLVGRNCSYQLPKQNLATFSSNPNKTLRQDGWIALYLTRSVTCTRFLLDFFSLLLWGWSKALGWDGDSEGAGGGERERRWHGGATDMK